MKNIIINLFAAAALSLALISCADLQNDAVVDPELNKVGAHPAGSLNPASENFHGKFQISENFGNCKTCHGGNLTGAATQVACVQCHTTGIQIHQSGILAPESPNYHAKFFHGNYAALASCKSCHDAENNYRGSAVSPTCADAGCHESSRGPEGCSTCHSISATNTWVDLEGHTDRSFKGVGAHRIHLLGGALGVKVENCYTCHKRLDNGVFSESHLDNSDGAELVWSALAVKTTDVNNIKPNPVYTNTTCSNTYCHGYFKNGNLDNTVSWVAGSDQVKCGSCHGDPATGNPLPKGNHVKRDDCESCHGDVVGKNGEQYVLKDVTKHMNGKLTLFGEERDF